MITKTVELRKGYFYTIERVGQEPPHVGDKVIAEVRIYLPTDTTAVGIESDIHFGSRLCFAGEDLRYSWGEHSLDKLCRFRVSRFQATHWSKAFDLAEAYAREQFNLLFSMIDKRALALKEAEG